MDIKKGLQSLFDMKAFDNKGKEGWPGMKVDPTKTPEGFKPLTEIKESNNKSFGVWPISGDFELEPGKIKATKLVVDGETIGSIEEWPTASWEGATLEEAAESIAAGNIIGYSITEAEQYAHNGLMADQPLLIFETGREELNRKEIERGNGIITALRIRSKKKAESNKMLSKLTETLGKQLRASEKEKYDLKWKYNEEKRRENEMVKDLAELEQDNARLVDDYVEMGEVNAALEEEKQAAIKAADEYKAEAERYFDNDRQHKELYEQAAEENNRLAEEVRKGNEYREGQKGTILELHETIKKEIDRRTGAENDLQHVAADLQRANGVIDLILRGTRF